MTLPADVCTLNLFSIILPQFQYNILWLPCLWPPEGCTPKTLFCGWQQAATQHAWTAPTLQQRVLHDQCTTPHAKVEKCADNEHGKNVPIMETLWKNNLNFVHNVPMIYVNFTTIVITFFEKKNRKHYFHMFFSWRVSAWLNPLFILASKDTRQMTENTSLISAAAIHILHVHNILYLNHTRRNIYWPTLHGSKKYSFFLQVGYEIQVKFYYWHLIRISV
jgi:hypothetical protein